MFDNSYDFERAFKSFASVICTMCARIDSEVESLL